MLATANTQNVVLVKEELGNHLGDFGLRLNGCDYAYNGGQNGHIRYHDGFESDDFFTRHLRHQGATKLEPPEKDKLHGMYSSASPTLSSSTLSDFTSASLPTANEKPKRKSHSKKREPGHIPRPRNAFIIFRCDFVENNRVPASVEYNHRNVSRIAGRVWNALPASEKRVWKIKADQELMEHRQKYPHFRYKIHDKEEDTPTSTHDDTTPKEKEKSKRRKVGKKSYTNTDAARCVEVANLVSSGHSSEEIALRMGQPPKSSEKLPTPTPTHAPIPLAADSNLLPIQYRGAIQQPTPIHVASTGTPFLSAHFDPGRYPTLGLQHDTEPRYYHRQGTRPPMASTGACNYNGPFSDDIQIPNIARHIRASLPMRTHPEWKQEEPLGESHVNQGYHNTIYPGVNLQPYFNPTDIFGPL